MVFYKTRGGVTEGNKKPNPFCGKILGKRRPVYKGNLIGFEMGPSVKFVSAIIDGIFNKKRG